VTILINIGCSLATYGGGVHLPHTDVQMPWAQDALERPCTRVASHGPQVSSLGVGGTPMGN